MALITVTIDLRDLDRTIGPPPPAAKVTFARLSPTEEDGTLISTRPVAVPLADGHGAVQLQADTGYLVDCYSVPGFTRFAIRTSATATSLGELWRTGQIDPAGFGAAPVPQTVEQALAELRAEIAAGGGGGGGTGPSGFQYLQSNAAASWSIPHAFGRRPNVELYTLAGERIFTDVAASTTAVYVTFPSPTSGYAVLT